MTSAGVWIARTDASGYPKVGDYYNYSNISSIKDWSQRAGQGACGPYVVPPTTTTGVGDAIKRCATILVTIAAAPPSAATTLLAAVASVRGHIRIKKIWTDVTDAAVTLTFDADGGTLVGPAVHTVNLTQYVVNTQLEDLLLYSGTDNKAIRVTISDGPGAGASNTYIQIEAWYED